MKRFELWAAGDALDSARNGYYTWARFGFDARLTPQQRSLLIHPLADAETINAVIKRGGQDWWKRYGCDTSMVFDLSDGSAMMEIFNDYLREKGIIRE